MAAAFSLSISDLSVFRVPITRLRQKGGQPKRGFLRCVLLHSSLLFVLQLVWKLPFFGISLWLIGMILIDRRWTDDEHRIRETFKHVSEGKKRPVWVISYLEGLSFALTLRRQDIGLSQSHQVHARPKRTYSRAKNFHVRRASPSLTRWALS